MPKRIALVCPSGDETLFAYHVNKLNKLGIGVDWFNYASCALKALSEKKYPLIVFDGLLVPGEECEDREMLEMARQSRYRDVALRVIRLVKAGSQNKDTPIYVLSRYTQNKDVFMEAGADYVATNSTNSDETQNFAERVAKALV